MYQNKVCPKTVSPGRSSLRHISMEMRLFEGDDDRNGETVLGQTLESQEKPVNGGIKLLTPKKLVNGAFGK
jgi:hypothetical protein